MSTSRSTPHLVELAKQGNPRAIAHLINQQLSSRGITAMASREGNCLRLLLEAPKPPNQTILLPYICKALTRLEAPALTQAEIYGRRQGAARGWQATLEVVDHRFVEVGIPPQAKAASLAHGPISRKSSQPVAPYSRVLPRGEAAQRRRQERSRQLPPHRSPTRIAPGSQRYHVSAGSDREMDSLEASLMVSPRRTARGVSPGVSPGVSRSRPDVAAPLQSRSAPSSPVRPQPAAASAPSRSDPPSSHPTALLTPPASSSSDASPLPSNPSRLSALGIWLQWQRAAWTSTLLLIAVAAPVLVLLLFGIFSLVNRFSNEQMMLVLDVCLLFVLPLLGLLLGEAQTRVLRRRLYGIGGWRWMTLLGVVLGFAIAIGSHFALQNIFSPVIADPTPEFVIGRSLPFISSTLAVGFGCLLLGFLQWLMLSTSIPGSYIWPLVTSLSSMASWVLGMAIGSGWLAPRLTDTASSSGFWSTLLLGLSGGLLSWLLFHALSGLAMARLLCDRPLLDPGSEVDADGFNGFNRDETDRDGADQTDESLDSSMIRLTV